MRNSSGRVVSKVRLTFFVIFSILIIGSIIVVAVEPDINITGAEWFNINLFRAIAIGLTFLMSLCLLKINKKSIFITISLIAYCVACYFFISLSSGDSDAETALDVMFYSLLAHQLILAIYSVSLAKGAGLKVLEIAVRVALSLTAYFVLTETLPQYFDFKNALFMVYLVNALISIVSLSCHIKTHYLSVIGILLAAAGAIFYAFNFGWLTTFNITGDFVDFLATFDIGFVLSALGIYLTACDAVFSGIFRSRLEL